jgi:O-antigen ligase
MGFFARFDPAALLWITGFACALLPAGSYEAHAYGLAFVSVCGALGISLWKAKLFVSEFPQKPLLFLAATFWGLAFLSVTLSEAPYVSFLYFCFFSLLPITALTALLAHDRMRFFKTIVIFLAFLYAGLSLSCLYQYFFSPDLLFDGFVFSPLGSPNTLAALLSLGFFCALGCMLAVPSRLHANVALVLALFIFAALLTTGCRAALLALAASLGIFFVFGRAHFTRHRRCVTSLLLGAFLIFIAFALLPHEGGKTVLDRLAGTVNGEMPALWSRPAIWLSTLAIIRDHFWTGTGIGTFFLYYPQYRGYDLRSAGLMAHSDPLQFWAEMGILAPLIFYTFIAGAVLRTWTALKVLHRGEVKRIFLLTPFCALAAMIAHSHVSFNFYVLPLLLLAGLLLAFWLFQIENNAAETPLESTTPGPGLAARTMLVMTLLIMGTFFILLHGAYILTVQADQRLLRGDIEGFAGSVNAADRLSFHKSARAFILASSLPAGLLSAQKDSLSFEEAERIFIQGWDLLLRAKGLNPRQSEIPYKQAQLLQMMSGFTVFKSHDYQTPEELLLQSLHLDPLYLDARLMLARLYEERDHSSRALQVLREGLEWPYASVDQLAYYQYAASLSLQQGDMQTHAAALRKILKQRTGGP